MLDSLKSPLTVLGRVLLALMFVLAGISKLGNIGGTAAYIASGGLPMPAVLAVYQPGGPKAFIAELEKLKAK